MKILITGATGFVGRAVTKSACLAGHDVTALVRNISDALPEQVSQIAVGNFADLGRLDECSLDSHYRGNDGVVYGNDENIVISSEAEKSQNEFTEPALNRAEADCMTEECHSERSRGILKDASINVGMTVAEHIERLISAMQDTDVVIHTAARAHVMKEKQSDPAETYRQINVTFTERLAAAAAKAGVKRFVFLSSIKVNGESTTPIPAFPHQWGRSNSSTPSPNRGPSSTPSPQEGEGWGEGAGKPFTEKDIPNPQDPYAISKWQAEQALIEIGQRTGMEIVILRPPMIYGPGVKGNFANLLKLVNKGIPVPFGNVNNQRSLLALDNLVSVILLSAKHRAAANQTFLVADDEAVSTTQLIRNIATAQGKKARLIPIPVSLMTFAAKVLGKQFVADRLFGSLQIDTTKIQKQLGWRPVVTMHQQLEKMFTELDDGFPPARE